MSCSEASIQLPARFINAKLLTNSGMIRNRHESEDIGDFADASNPSTRMEAKNKARRGPLQRLWRTAAWLGLHEFGVLLTLAGVAGGVWLFVMISGEVVDGSTQAFDERLLMAMRTADDVRDPVGPEWLQEMGRDMTALGGVAVMVLITGAVAVYLLLQRKILAMLFVLASVGGGVILSLLLKAVYDRPRPDLVPYGSYVTTASFPSGHSMIAAVVYLTLGALLARVEPQWRVKAFVMLTAAFLTFVVGISRVYMGVHWPTDVLAGWTAGASWALLCWLIARHMQRRGQIETDISQVGPG